jgi:antitoxin VapB
VSAALGRLRAALGAAEVARFRALGRQSADAMAAAAARVQPGQTEHQIAASMASELLSRGVSPVVLQVATDDRVLSYRHVLPTDRRLERYAFLSFCSRGAGLVCSMTRTLYFGRVPEGLLRKQRAAAAVDATLIAGTRPGARVRELFTRAAQRYADEGFEGEWRLHHQGGAAGYEPREYVATPTSEEVVAAGQAFAWNPTVHGAKCEDTIAVGPSDNEILTEMAGWPTLDAEVDGRVWKRPAIREIT